MLHPNLATWWYLYVGFVIVDYIIVLGLHSLLWDRETVTVSFSLRPPQTRQFPAGAGWTGTSHLSSDIEETEQCQLSRSHDDSISISGPGRYSGNPEYSPGTDGATEQISVEEAGTCDEIHQAEQTKCGRHQEGNKTGWNVGLLLIKRQIFH